METCGNGHTHKIEDLLAHATNYEAVPCPSCVDAKQLPPFCFSRQQCLEHASYPETLFKCPRCEEADRRVNLNALKIIPPHVFLSYCDGSEQMPEVQSSMSTQSLIASIRLQLQQLTGLVLYTRAAKPGQSEGGTLQCDQHPALSPSRAVLVFLSDAYCASEVCRRECSSAIQEAKYLLPVLLPTRGPSSGWTGAGGERKDWWIHAQECASDPEITARHHRREAMNWSALSLFSPIDLRDRPGQQGGTQGQDLQETAVFEIVQRLQVLLHRRSPAQRELENKYTTWRRTLLLQRLQSFPRNPSPSCDWPVLMRTLAQEARKAFDTLDADADGKLSEEQLSYWGVPGGVPVEDDELTAFEKSVRGGAAEAAVPPEEEGQGHVGPLDAIITHDLMRECDMSLQGCVGFAELWQVLEEALFDVYTL